MKLAICILWVCLFGNQLLPGPHIIGNGADVVVCENNSKKTVELLDFFEGEELNNIKPAASSASKLDYKIIVEIFLKRLSTVHLLILKNSDVKTAADGLICNLSINIFNNSFTIKEDGKKNEI